MNKALKLKVKIAKLDELLEKEGSNLMLYVNLKNDIYRELQETKEKVWHKGEEIKEIIKTNESLPEYIELIQKIAYKRETLESYFCALKNSVSYSKKKTIAKRMENLSDEIVILRQKQKELKKTKPVLMYIQATDELSKLKNLQAEKERFFEKAKTEVVIKSASLKKVILKKSELQGQLKKCENKERIL